MFIVIIFLIEVYMKKRQYTYNEVFRSVNKITTVINDINEDDIYKTLKDYLIFITVFNHIENVIKKLSKNKTKDLNKITIELIESNSSKFKEVLNTVLNRLVHTKANYLNEIKKDLFPDETQIDFNDIDLELDSLIYNLEDTDYSIDNLSDENKQTTYYNLSTDIIRILSVKDIDELIDIFMNVHQSNRNRYYLPHSFKTQVLPTFLSQYVQTEQNLVSFELSPHTVLESYKNSFFHLKQKIDFKNQETEIYFEDKENSKDYYNTIHSLIYNLKSFLPYVYTFEDDVQDNTKDTLVVSIYDSTSTLTPLELYEKSLKTCSDKCFILLPYSFISTRVKNFNEVSEEIKNIEFYEKTIEQIELHKELVESKKIEKIVSFPNNYFSHTLEPQVLLQVSKKPVQSIQFIDLSYLDKPIIQGHKHELFKSEQLKEVINSKSSEEVKNRNSQTISKYVSYQDIIEKHNYNLLVNHHLIEIDLDTNTKSLSEYFEIKKLQRFNHFTGRVPLKIYNVSEFKEFSYTKDRDITKTLRFEPPIPPLKVKEYFKLDKENKLTSEQKKQLRDFRKYQQNHQLQDYDILIYVDSTTDITILKNTPIYCIGNHNLLRLRTKNDYRDNIESLSKSLYLFLLSKDGQRVLERILTKSKSGKDVLSIEMLNQIQVDFSDKETQVKKFNEIETKQKMIDKLKKEIISITKSKISI